MNRLHVVLTVLVLGWFTSSGCTKSEPTAESPTAVPAAASTLPAGKTFWNAIYLQGKKIGHGQTTLTPITEDGQERVRVESAVEMKLSRQGQESTVQNLWKSLETPSGELIHFEMKFVAGPSARITEGNVRDGKLFQKSRMGDSVESSQVDLARPTGGTLAVERSLLASPMKAGQMRTLSAVSELGKVAEIELKAVAQEPVKLLDGTRQLLRIDRSMTLLGQPPITDVIWTDESGEVQKMAIPAMQMETFLTSEKVAKAEGDASPLDLVVDNLVRLDRPLEKGHETRQAVYRVHLTSANPAQVFPSGGPQQVTPIDEHTAELHIKAQAPQDRAAASADVKQPGESALQANNLVNIKDPRIARMADDAAGDETDPLKLALRLEAFVYKAIKKKNFSQTLASASDVAQSLEGDCTEHSVLLTALARAKGLPTRVAIGLVYLPNQAGFGFHMWNEMWIDGRWVSLDGTMGRGGIGAAHVKISDSTLEAADAYGSFMPVAQVLGQVKLELLEAS